MRVQLKRVGNKLTARFGIVVIMGLAVESQVLAQAQRLPPPPPTVPITPAPSAPLPTVPVAPAPIDGVQNPNDRIYTAPRTNPILSPRQPASEGFRVFVDSDSPFLLQQVRSIQPDAFIQNFAGRRVIQAGLFNDELKARQQVSRLAAQGIDAQVTGRSPQFDFGDAARGYYAVIPGNPREVQDYRDRAIRIGVSQSLVQIRDRPRGLHLAVGPFSNRREADQVVQYLRDRGSLDARLFYDR
ncbi:MAG: hypothetical protein KME10_09970 [Plectolyngbya sp. WJT66-NPBG17]|jgi:hypothetical protein|nr:hypothetical protein [Plectolyngbya sp. WJT66-NPBG17]MBW4525610.1 hypothetical protein [Phormidium tanganyikae FI6-MK23]